jgi:hypothetical protein
VTLRRADECVDLAVPMTLDEETDLTSADWHLEEEFEDRCSCNYLEKKKTWNGDDVASDSDDEKENERCVLASGITIMKTGSKD